MAPGSTLGRCDNGILYNCWSGVTWHYGWGRRQVLYAAVVSWGLGREWHVPLGLLSVSAPGHSVGPGLVGLCMVIEGNRAVRRGSVSPVSLLADLRGSLGRRQEAPPHQPGRGWTSRRPSARRVALKPSSWGGREGVGLDAGAGSPQPGLPGAPWSDRSGLTTQSRCGPVSFAIQG